MTDPKPADTSVATAGGFDLQTIVADVNAATPAINALVAAFDPAIAGAVVVAESLIKAGAAMAAKKAEVDPALWAAQAERFNAGAADIAAAEAAAP